ncbi:MAG: hypothetical protein HUK26_01350 [Duodenibacillus sp.]|nr:hypothetical protein [Duodenibacillus sp.]
MRRDLVVQVIVDYGGSCENFATPYEAESFINGSVDELDLPQAAWLEDMSGNKKWDYDLVDDGSGVIHLVERPIAAPRLRRTFSPH